MTITSLCTLVVLAAAPGEVPPDAAQPPQIYSLSQPAVIVRGQSFQPGSPFYGGGAIPVTAPPGSGIPPVTPYRPAQFNPAQDPFLNSPGGPGSLPPIYTPQGGGTAPSWLRNGQRYYSGLNGPQPYRLDRPRLLLDFEYIPGQDVSNGQGEFESFGFDGTLEFTQLLNPGLVFTHAPQFGLRTWQSPLLTGNERLPSTVFRFGWDFEFSTPENGTPWSFVLGFNPSINTDFESGLSSRGINLDGRAAAIYRANPQLQYVAGLMYWDRVNDRILPYGGVVWTPNDRAEIRAMFPEARVSYYVGNVADDDKWLYVKAGYHVESYQIDMDVPGGGGREDQIEIADWRVMLGLRSESNYFGTFIEGGYVFDREVEFGGQTTDFTIDDGFILRAGIRY